MTSPESTEGTAEPRHLLRGALLMALFAALLVLPPVGRRVIVSGDEARFAVLAQDMMQRQSWTDAHIRDRRYRNKPLLYPWAIRVLSTPGGRVTQTTAQMPVALAAIAAVFFTTLLGQQLFGRRAGLWAGLITTTSYGFFAHSQILLPDMIVIAFGLAAFWAFWASISHPPGRVMLAAFYAALALGFAAKGPAGLLPLAVVLTWILTEDGWRGLGRLGSKRGAAVFVALSAIWLVPFLAAGTGTFARNVVVQNWLGWYLGGPRPMGLLNYVAEFARGLIPWTTLLVLPLLWVRAEWRNARFRFAFLAWLVPLVVTGLSQNQRTRYLLPTFPTAALLIAWWADRRGTEPARAIPIVAALSAIGGLAGLIVSAAPWFDPAEGMEVAGLLWRAGVLGVVGVALIAFQCWALVKRRPALLVPGVALATALVFLAGVWMHNEWVNRTQDFPQLAALVERHAKGGDVGVLGGRFFSVDVYLGRQLTPVRTEPLFLAFLARPDQPVAILSERVWNSFREDVRANIEVLERLRVRRQYMLVVRAREPGATAKAPGGAAAAAGAAASPPVR
jgi:4-amino-4-deoxy-L-arabinose transferase-like glycosyltransferase